MSLVVERRVVGDSAKLKELGTTVFQTELLTRRMQRRIATAQIAGALAIPVGLDELSLFCGRLGTLTKNTLDLRDRMIEEARA